MIETGIVQLMKVESTVAPLAPGGIWAIRLPDKPKLPAITYQRISTVAGYDLDGAVDLTQMRLQIDVWAERIEQAKPLAEAILDLLESFSGPLPTGDVIYDVELAPGSLTDYFDEPSQSFRVQADYFISYPR